MIQYLIIITICLLASVIGSICGIGGGVIVKPVLDSMGIMSVETVSFLSGLMVMSMSIYSIGKAVAAKDTRLEARTGILLSLGAVAGGITGKQLFSVIQTLSSDPNRIGACQAVVLFLLTFGTLIYTIKKHTIRTHRMTHPVVCIIIGIILGLLSSFLGIGGGPFNLVFLSFFFSMETKTAAQNSLLIIMFSQISGFLQTLLTGSVPDFSWILLICMVVFAVIGAAIGRSFNRKLDNDMVDRLFCGLIIIILFICVYNFFKYI